MASLHLSTKVISGGMLGLLALVLPAPVRAFMCPPEDQLGFPVGPEPVYQNECGGVLFCSYPAMPAEDPNDFFCTYSTTTGFLIADHDAGLCPPTAPEGIFGPSPCTPTPTPSETGTATPTNTPPAAFTDTPTATPTNTPVPNGGACSSSGQCGSGLCVDAICVVASAPAPALTPWGLMAAAVLLASVGGLALRRSMRGP